jgi:hypothetical protein
MASNGFPGSVKGYHMKNESARGTPKMPPGSAEITGYSHPLSVVVGGMDAPEAVR